MSDPRDATVELWVRLDGDGKAAVFDLAVAAEDIEWRITGVHSRDDVFSVTFAGSPARVEAMAELVNGVRDRLTLLQ